MNLCISMFVCVCVYKMLTSNIITILVVLWWNEFKPLISIVVCAKQERNTIEVWLIQYEVSPLTFESQVHLENSFQWPKPQHSPGNQNFFTRSNFGFKFKKFKKVWVTDNSHWTSKHLWVGSWRHLSLYFLQMDLNTLRYL